MNGKERKSACRCWNSDKRKAVVQTTSNDVIIPHMRPKNKG